MAEIQPIDDAYACLAALSPSRRPVASTMRAFTCLKIASKEAAAMWWQMNARSRGWAPLVALWIQV
jgi:hypothetical protein